MKQISLTKKEFAIVDDEDFVILNEYKWFAMKPRNKFYACRADENGKKQYMHRLILKVIDSKIHIDHIDGNGLNNQKANLRLCSNAQNLMNRGLNKNNQSGFKGVYFSQSKNRWIAQLKVNRQKITRSARTKNEAAEKYNELAKFYFGEFAKLNDV